jgi:hypothetical protein
MQTERLITIPATGYLSWQITGRVFKCFSTTADFSVYVDNGEPQTISAGRGFGDSSSAAFERLTFRNTSGSAIAATVAISDGPITDPQATLTATVSSVSAKDPSTYTKATTVAVNATTTFNGLDGTKQRKQIIVTNPGSTSASANTMDVLITDNAGTAAGNVPPGQSFTLVTNGTLKVNNPAGNAAVAKVLETFYT